MIVLEAISKSYLLASANAFKALEDISVTFQPGEFIAVLGRSGSGKSTLLNLIAGLDYPSEGRVLMDSQDLSHLDESALACWRGRHTGIIFQFFQLLPTLTIAENVLLAMDFARAIPRGKRKKRTLELLQKMGIGEQANKFPATLSGGEQQRAAIARALANDPSVLIADEPTGNLDVENAQGVASLFALLAKEGKTVVMVTHDTAMAKRAQRIIRLADGRMVEDRKQTPDTRLLL